MDDYGAPRYPELVLAVKGSTLKKKRELIDTMLEAIEKGTFKALDDRDATVKKLVDASRADEPLVRAQLAAVSRALLPPVSLDRRVLHDWAAFEKQFGITKEEPDVDQTFPLR